MKPFLVPVLLVLSISAADTATQTDWSGGPGTPGPVTAWGDVFAECIGVLWSDIPGQLTIDPETSHLVEAESQNTDRVLAADLDGDMDADLLGGAFSTSSWWENADGLGGEWTGHPIGTVGEVNMATDDVDSDGDVDILASTDNDVMWLENDGSGAGWVVHTIYVSMSRSVEPCGADVDGDGDEDVICANFTFNDGVISWWENLDGCGLTWALHQFSAATHGYNCVSADDLDGDGDCDILAAAVYDSDMFWIENINGQGTSWLRVTIDFDYDSALRIYSDDLDGDGDCDVLGAGDSETGISWWENLDGAGTSWIGRPIGEGSGLDFHGEVGAADLDSDGDGDISASTWFPSSFVWMENADGEGTVWEPHVLDSLSGYSSADMTCIADFDGDGRQDVAGCSWTLDDIWWWSLIPSGRIESSILYAGNDPDWEMISWSATVPAGTAAGFQVRASDDPAAMGAWSDTLLTPASLHGLLADSTSYFQYRVILTTTDPAVTPVLEEVTVTWDPLGAGGGEAPAVLELLPVMPNPCSGLVSVQLGLPAAGQVDFSVFDISGRLVERIAPAEFQPGWHAIQLGDLGTGVYFVQIRAGGFGATERFVVVE